MTSSGLSINHDINKHIMYVLGVLKRADHETWGLSTAIDYINFNLQSREFSSVFFTEEFAKFLAKVDIIEKPIAEEVHALSARIIAMFGRNYRLIELLTAFEVIHRAWEVQREVLKNVENSDS